MNKYTIKNKYPQFRGILKKTWKSSFDEDLDKINHQNKVDRIVAVIKEMSLEKQKKT